MFREVQGIQCVFHDPEQDSAGGFSGKETLDYPGTEKIMHVEGAYQFPFAIDHQNAVDG